MFEDYSDGDLETILRALAAKDGFTLQEEAVAVAIRNVSKKRASPNFGNARTLENDYGSAKKRSTKRRGLDRFCLTKEDFDDGTSPEQSLRALDGLYNIGKIKDYITRLTRLAESYKANGRDVKSLLRHYTFIGSPGTGKTTGQ